MGQVAETVDHVQLARRFDDLHQLLYTRGGIRPSNSAVEELTKLLLMRIAADRHPKLPISESDTLSDVLNPDRIRRSSQLTTLKDAFTRVNCLPDMAAHLPGDGIQSVWPADEPLRITRSDIAAEALQILLP